jgi:hypothetical protein
VPMPEPITALLEAFVRAYYVDVPFKKRQRSPMARVAGGIGDDG